MNLSQHNVGLESIDSNIMELTKETTHFTNNTWSHFVLFKPKYNLTSPILEARVEDTLPQRKK